MIVLDASAMVELLFGTSKGQQVRDRYLGGGESFHLPHLLDLEVVQVLRRYSNQRMVADRRIEQALQDFLDFPLTRHPHEALLPRVWELRANLTAYDGVYVALAEVLNVPMVTCDGRLAHAPGHRAKLVLVS